MSITDADAQGQTPSPDENVDFSFLPKILLEKCKPFIIRYHELNGFSSLPDILWHTETRKFIDANPALRQLFKKSTSRGAQKANEGLVLIATLILSTEILAIGLAGWAKRHPAARKKAQALLTEYAPNSRARLTERYLFSQIDRSRTALVALAPSDLMKADQQKKFASGRREDFRQSNLDGAKSLSPISKRPVTFP
jgi:hypothetical protein